MQWKLPNIHKYGCFIKKIHTYDMISTLSGSAVVVAAAASAAAASAANDNDDDDDDDDDAE